MLEMNALLQDMMFQILVADALLTDVKPFASAVQFHLTITMLHILINQNVLNAVLVQRFVPSRQLLTVKDPVRLHVRLRQFLSMKTMPLKLITENVFNAVLAFISVPSVQ